MNEVSPVLSFVSGSNRAGTSNAALRQTYRETVVGIRQTFLLVGDDNTVAVATGWESREALDGMLASREEPFARRLLREAGGDPQFRLFEVAAEAGLGS
jgi:heme-degrading monooxygenase HmoA